MKIVLFDCPYDTKYLSPQDIQAAGQFRLNLWLGKDKVKFEVHKIEEKIWKFTLWRTYGPWYKDPKPWSDCNEKINSWDENIFLGTEYQTGTEADFENHPGPYIINPDIETIFLPDMKQMAKKHHGSRIRSLSVDNNLDHVELTITYV